MTWEKQLRYISYVGNWATNINPADDLCLFNRYFMLPVSILFIYLFSFLWDGGWVRACAACAYVYLSILIIFYIVPNFILKYVFHLEW